MNTTENNKLIVQFMELKPTKVNENFYSLAKNHVHITGKNPEIVISGFSECAKYNSDWNWLMEVVEKIESLGAGIEIYNNYCKIIYNDEIIYEIEENSKKESVYNASVEFIKWHNGNN
jgi:hypothetical protein